MRNVKLLFALTLVLLANIALAQQQLNFPIFRGNYGERELILPLADSAKQVTAKAFYSQYGRPLPDNLQPYIIRSAPPGTQVIVRFEKTDALPDVGWVEVYVSGIIRASGRMVVGKSSQAGGGPPITPPGVGNPIDYSSLINKPVLFNGDYLALFNRPTIPTVPGWIPPNDPGYLTVAVGDTRYQAAGPIDYATLANKPYLFSGSYRDLADKPVLFSGAYPDLTNKPVLFSGNYIDLIGKPQIPVVPSWIPPTDPNYLTQPVADTRYRLAGPIDYLSLTNRPTQFSGAYGDLTGKPVLFSGSYLSLTDRPVLFSGSYLNLTDVPSAFTPTYHTQGAATIVTDTSRRFVSDRQIAQWNSSTGSGFSGKYIDLTGKPVLFSGSYPDLTNKPTFSSVASSGSYLDLLNRPTIPAATVIANNLTTTDANQALAAPLGKVLNDSLTLLRVRVAGKLSINDTNTLVRKVTGYRLISPAEIAKVAATSGTNTGDQVLSQSGQRVTLSGGGGFFDLPNASGSPTPIANNLTTTTQGSALDATQGKILKDQVDLKQDAIAGKGLSTNDYTTAEKTKLASQSGTNTGDETASTIKSKLGVTTLSGSNTGDQTITNNLTTTAIGTALDAAQGKLLKDAVDANTTGVAQAQSTANAALTAANTAQATANGKQNTITSATDLVANSVTVSTPTDSDSTRKVATTDWVRRYVKNVMPTFIDFPYRSSQFTFTDSLAIRADYIRSLFSVTGSGGSYNATTGVFSLSAGGTSGPWSTSGSAAYYNVGPVGLGTSTPRKLFDVQGTAVFTSIYVRGQNDAETDANVLENAPGSGIRIRGGYIHNANTIRHEGNGNFITDGNTFIRALGRDDRAIFINPGGISIGNGTNTANATLDVTGTGKFSGNTTFGGSVTATGNVKAGSLTLADGLPITQFGPGNGIDYAGNGTFQLRNSTVITLMENQLKSYDGYDPTVSKVLSTTGSTFRWIVPPTSTTASSGTTSPALSGTALAAANRDSVLINADSTKMRFASSGTTVTNISTVAQLRSFLTTTQTNVRGVLANGTYDDGAAFEQTGTWTNVSLEAANFRQAILQNSSGNLVWIDQGGNSRRRVRLKDFVIRTGATDASNGLAIYHHNELPDWDGLEWDGLEIYHTNPTAGKSNGFTFAIYSEGKSGAQDMTLKNVFVHNCYIHDIPRANEFLSHGFDKDRIFNVVVTNNRFERTGVNDSYGAPLSYSGRIKYILTKGNSFKEFNYLATEHVANRFALTTTNTYSSTATNGGVAIAISDNNLNLTQWLYVENNTVNVMSRPFYAYGVKNLYMTGGTYNGYLGADGTPVNSVFKNFTLNVWPKAGQSVYNYCWQFDGNAYGNSVSNITVSSAGAQAKSPGSPTAYTVHLTSQTNNNTFDNVTTILGKQSNGSWGGSGAIINDGANSNVITNNTVSRVD